MAWIGEAISEQISALGPRLYTLGALATGAVAVVGVIYLALTGVHMSSLEIGSIVVLVFLAVFWLTMLDHTVRLRRLITPKVTIGFESSGCLVPTPLKIRDASDPKNVVEVEAVYLRAVVRNVGRLAAKECEAYLTNVQRKMPNGDFTDTDFSDAMDLPWSMREGRAYLPMSIGPQVRRYFDVLVSRKDNNELQFAGIWPLRLRKFFGSAGIYKLDLAVLADGATVTAAICVDWNGKWDEIKAYMDATKLDS